MADWQDGETWDDIGYWDAMQQLERRIFKGPGRRDKVNWSKEGF